VTRVENGSQTTTGRERADHDLVHLVVDNVTGLLKVDRVDNLVVAVVLIAVQVLGLTAVAGAAG
jgi:hypothetical protein